MSPALADRPRLLCVDDEPTQLTLLRRMVGDGYAVETAMDGRAALDLIDASGPFAVVVSDQRMPGMTGDELLELMRRRHPLTVRVLLTGETELSAAVTAMNRAALFRFLMKPCKADVLHETLEAAVAQHRLQAAEQDLLQRTLVGSISALVEVLAIANPLAFGRVPRLKELALGIAAQLEYPAPWQLEYAAWTAPLGHISLPEPTLRKLHEGSPLSGPETLQVRQAAHLSARIIGTIPRLGPVEDILLQLATGPAGADCSEPAAVGARILHAVAAFETAERTTGSASAALARLKAQPGKFDAAVIDALQRELGATVPEQQAVEIALGHIELGMVTAEDVHLRTGALLVPKGYRVTESFLARLRHFNHALLPAVVRMWPSDRHRR